MKVEGATTDGPAAKLAKKRAPKKSARVKKGAQMAVTDVEKPEDTAKQSGKATRMTKGKVNDTSKAQTTGASAHADSYTHTEWGTSSPAIPPRSEESFKGRKHPPRTYLYPSTHLTALEGVKWDDAGFECMELSALPWIAGAGYAALEVRFGKRDVLFGERFLLAVLADGSVECRDRRCAFVCVQTRRFQGVYGVWRRRGALSEVRERARLSSRRSLEVRSPVAWGWSGTCTGLQIALSV